MPPARSHALKWPLFASVLAHGVALAWLPVPEVVTPPPAPPLEVRLLSPTPEPAVPLPKPHRQTARASTRPAPAPAEPSSAAAESNRPPAPVPAALRPASAPAELAQARAMAQTADGSMAVVSGALPAWGQAGAAQGALRLAHPAEAQPALQTTAPMARAPAPATATAAVALGPGPVLQPAAAAEAVAPPSHLPETTGPAGDVAAQGAPGLASGLVHERDKTPWAGALPAAHPAQPLPLPAPAPGMGAGPAREVTAEPVMITAATGVLQVGLARPLSLLEAEGMPGSAIAYARLTAQSRACYRPPPVHWNAQGRVVLRVHVDTTGRPAAVMLESGSGEPRLDRLAMEQTRSCARFEIVDVHGRPRAAVVRLPVVYRFEE